MTPAEIAARIIARAIAAQPDDRPRKRKPRTLTAEHRQRIADSVRKSWPERRLHMPARFGRPKGSVSR